jgi:hypothetical protein
MSASALSFLDWQKSVMDELHEQINALAAVVVNLDPSHRMHLYVNACKAAWCAGNVAEVERLLSEAVEWLEQCELEREWHAAHIRRSKWAAR